MPTMAEMVEAHLLNVQREINNLQQRKVAIDEEIEKLSKYLQEGGETLKSSEVKPIELEQAPVSPVFNFGGNDGK